jgi:AraC family transcriptional regulator, ethanolamine operon transcriptional activator
MPTRTFSTFEAFFAANLHSDLRGMVLGRRREKWVMTQLAINNLSVQWGRAGSSVVVEGPAKPGGVSIFLPTENTLGVSGNGHRLDESSLMINQTGDEFCIANDSSRPWFSVYIPYETLAGAGGDPTIPIPFLHGFVQVPLPRIQRFRLFIGQFGEAVQRGPGDFETSGAKCAAERKLVPEIRSLLAVPQEAGPMRGRHAIPRRQIICLAMDFIDQHEGDYLSVEQLASAAGVSERTLRDAFQHYFGLAPVRYLNRRALHQVRSALQAADPSVATVTKVATEFGVWELGRFARDYRNLFGELPSETLRR